MTDHARSRLARAFVMIGAFVNNHDAIIQPKTAGMKPTAYWSRAFDLNGELAPTAPRAAAVAGRQPYACIGSGFIAYAASSLRFRTSRAANPEIRPHCGSKTTGRPFDCITFSHANAAI